MAVNQHNDPNRAAPRGEADTPAPAGPVNRRTILAMAMGLGAASFLAACGSTRTRT